MMMTTRLAIFASLAGVLACGKSAGRQADSMTRVGITSGAGSMGGVTLHDDARGPSRTVIAPVDAVWQVLPQVYETLGIPGAGAVPGRRMYGARDSRPRRIEGKRLSAYIDCGMGPTATPKADEYAIRMTLVSTLTAESDATTVVETMLEASGRPRGTAGQNVSCQSNLTLEARVHELLTEALLDASGAGG